MSFEALLHLRLKSKHTTYLWPSLTLTLREDVRVEVVHSVRASRWQEAELSAVNRGQRVDGERERDLSERHLHVSKGESAGVLPVQLQNLISRIQTCSHLNMVIFHE